MMIRKDCQGVVDKFRGKQWKGKRDMPRRCPVRAWLPCTVESETR